MGTNYYIMITNKELVEKYFPNEYKLVDYPYFGYEVHIGKRSCGWKPLFQTHKNAYDSVEEMKNFINRHKNDIRIFDECGEEFDIKGLEDELINWAEYQKIRHMKYIPDGVSDEIFGGKKYLVESTEDDYDITIPYDHIEYERLDPHKENRSWFGCTPMYSKDKNGYDFLNGDFS